MKKICITAGLFVIALSVQAIQTEPRIEGDPGASTAPMVREFAQFIETSPEMIRAPALIPASGLLAEAPPVPAAKPLDDSQKLFVGELFEEFKKPDRALDPAWRRNVEDLIDLAEETHDFEALDLSRAEILNMTADASLNPNTKELVRRWIVRYQSIETREDKRSQVSISLLDH
ncbi:MAG: hypothetical protein H7333_03655 [Bdellovibrionales bacterium]|nr:hypothetical protein [Oligoflexia bacterium]